MGVSYMEHQMMMSSRSCNLSRNCCTLDLIQQISLSPSWVFTILLNLSPFACRNWADLNLKEKGAAYLRRFGGMKRDYLSGEIK